MSLRDPSAQRPLDVNRAYYERTTAGRADYWHKMAAPRHRLDVLLRTLASQRPARVVDLGCGNGVLLEAVRQRLGAVACTGVDLSEPQIALNRANAPWADWHAADLSQPGAIPDALAGCFDAVLASEVVEHMEDPVPFLRNARVLARPGGTLLLTTQSGPVRETERRVGHHRHFTADEMTALLATSGWTPERVWNSGFPFHDLSKWAANLQADRAMATFGEGAYGWKQDLVCLALRGLFRMNSGRRGAQLFAVARRTDAG